MRRNIVFHSCLLMVFILPALLLLPSCGKGESGGEKPTPESIAAETATVVTGGPSVLLVTVDTLRADRLSCYGFTGGATPYIDELAAAGALFEDTVTPVPITLPSHATILTGLYPSTLGVHNNGTYRLGQQAVTLAEMFRDAGYRTGAFVGSYVLDSVFGLDQGFDVYDDKMPERRGAALTQRRADLVVSAAVKWLAVKSPKPFFAWVHIWDPHYPYTPPEPMKSGFPEDPYFGEVVFVDAQVGLLVKSLKALGFKGENLLVAITADHGEGLGDHDESSHGVFIYDSTLQVPLVMRMGGKIAGGQRIPHMVRTLDIASTLLELVGLQLPDGMDGVSLAPLMAAPGDAGPPAADPGLRCYLESVYGQENYGWSPLFGIRTGQSKYIRAPEQEFYRLDRDRDELDNRFTAEPDAAGELAASYEGLAGQLTGGETLADQDWRPAKSVTSRLELLGYLWALPPGRDGSAEGGTGVDPKTMIKWDARREEGLALVRQGSRDAGLKILREVAAGDPSNPMVWENIAEGEMARRNRAEALAAAERGLALRPRNPNLNIFKGTLLIQMGRSEEAVHHLQGQLESHPDKAAIHYHLGDAYSTAGQDQEALTHYNEAEKLGMRTPMVPFQRGMALFQAGRYGEAVEAFREAVQLKEDFAEAWLNIGVNSFRLKRYEEANEAYVRAVELDPDNALFRATYGYFLTRTNQTDEALRQLQKGLEIDPDHVWVHTNLAWYYCMGETRVRDGDKALFHSQKAVELSGPTPPENILNTHAEALSAAGKYDEAIALNARLKAAYPDNPYYKTQGQRFESSWFLDEKRRQAADEQVPRDKAKMNPGTP
jgi:arylsulfatase A-like enzyme/Flp pilus assembly protein TadD